jgi:uncharacterized phiE125 gp8 family phage protein
MSYYASMVGYASLSLTVSSPPQSFQEPISMGELAVPLALDDDEAVAAELSAMISAVREDAEDAQGRDLLVKQWDMHLDYFPCRPIELRAPLVSVDLVRYRDSNGDTTTMVENTDYIVDTAKQPGVIMPVYNGTWPTVTLWPSSAILIRFTSGYSSSSPYWLGPGAQLKEYMKALIGQRFNQRLYSDKGVPEANDFLIKSLGRGALPRSR